MSMSIKRALKQGLLERLQAEFADDPLVSVYYKNPKEVHTPVSIVFGDIVQKREFRSAGGANRRPAQRVWLSLAVLIGTEDSQVDDPEDIEDAHEEYAQRVNDVIRNDPKLGIDQAVVEVKGNHGFSVESETSAFIEPSVSNAYQTILEVEGTVQVR